MTTVAFTRGLHEVGDGLFAYLQPTGTWGWSNAGLIGAGDTSLLVDTLFDERLTREMLETMRPYTDTRPIDSLINTHGDGDHCWGNNLIPAGARIYSTSAAVEDMRAANPTQAGLLKKIKFGGDLADFVANLAGPFAVEEVTMRYPDETVDEPRSFDVGGRRVDFIPVGPAHTEGDALVHVPDADVLFSGDILFIGGTPVTWHGPISAWIDACDRVLELGARTIVPGHGPVTDAQGVKDVQRYLRFVVDEAIKRHAAGMGFMQAADDIELGEFADWGDAERIVVNVDRVYSEIDPRRPATERLRLFGMMGRYRRRHGLTR